MKVIRKEDIDSNVYIKSYSKENGDLVLHTANGSNPRIIDMPENEVRIAQLMWKQHDNNRGYSDLLKNKMSRNIKCCVASAIVTGASLAAIFAFGDYLTFAQYVAGAVVATAGVGSAVCISIPRIISTREKLDDILKCNLLKKNEEYLNSNLDLDNVNHMEGVSYKTKKQLEETARRNEELINKSEAEFGTGEIEIEPYFTINTIDNMSLADLKRIRDNLKRDDYFSFEYNEQAKKESGKQKVYTNKD